MKKVIFGIIATVILTSSIFTSCSKEEEVKNEFNYSKLLLKPEQINAVIVDIENYKKRNENLKSTNRINTENEMQVILQPLIANGELIHNAMINEITTTNEFQNLTEIEKQEILNLTDEQLAELSFIVNFQYQTNNVDWDRVRSCASFALGISGIRNLYLNTAALGTVETMIGALRLIGKRYLGYVGVALMIYDFADCVYGD
ncbi:hypothetical protein [Flavobacterium sp.]|jgi:hypothetical protein|uniref:hypothetical protein n=1 Tax=Flavobacterium sp. TaxID=239 RepID=UPI0037C14E08